MKQSLNLKSKKIKSINSKLNCYNYKKKSDYLEPELIFMKDNYLPL